MVRSKPMGSKEGWLRRRKWISHQATRTTNPTTPTNRWLRTTSSRWCATRACAQVGADTICSSCSHRPGAGGLAQGIAGHQARVAGHAQYAGWHGSRPYREP